MTGFGDYLQYERRYSAHTLEGYSRDVRQFTSFLQLQYSITSFGEVTHHHVRSWMVSLLKVKTSPTSIRRKMSSLSQFFKWLRRKKVIAHNVMVKVPLPKVAERLPKSVPEKALQGLWNNDVEDGAKDGYSRVRDLAMIEICKFKDQNITFRIANKVRLLNKKAFWYGVCKFRDEIKNIIQFRRNNTKKSRRLL